MAVRGSRSDNIPMQNRPSDIETDKKELPKMDQLKKAVRRTSGEAMNWHGVIAEELKKLAPNVDSAVADQVAFAIDVLIDKRLEEFRNEK